ncbi:hypothetical protein [Epilithonimonas tenax]|uniref:hypothetical protein n=1 Tax=Epilithonimonas tenax TaxID=191577 RepID=UPI0006890C4C|nr:hypothetical protein [Epilithonimonas tenax]
MNSVDKSFKTNKDYYLFFGLIILVYFLSINTDYAEYTLHEKINIPGHFFYYTFGVDILVVVSWILILLYRKAGVILFPLFVAIHFALHNYFLSTFLYSDVTVLFLYIGLGLLAIIPRWKVLK